MPAETRDVASARFQPGDRVRVREGSPPGHVRTPGYIKGKSGVVEKVHGSFRNPEALAYGRDGLPAQPLYLVRFEQGEVWPHYASASRDKVVVDLYDHWLEEVPND